jgi:hypothetical protein
MRPLRTSRNAYCGRTHGNSATYSLKKRAALQPPVRSLHQLMRRQKLIEVVFAPGRRVVQPPRWPDVMQLAAEPDGQTLPEAALAAPRLADRQDARRPPEAARAAEVLVS